MNEQHQIKKEALAELMRMSKANGGKITPEALVEAARDAESPLHEYFEWDNDTAAEKYRLMQARTLIRSCRLNVTIHKRKMELPYYVRDPEADSSEQGYVETGRLPSQEDLAREVIVNEFKRAASQLRKARNMAEFFNMVGEIDELIETITGLQDRVSAQQSRAQLNA